MENYNQNVKIDVNQTNESIGCNCSCNLITPEKILNSISYIFKKLTELFNCGDNQNAKNVASTLI
jgi:hypothetical protein